MAMTLPTPPKRRVSHPSAEAGSQNDGETSGPSQSKKVSRPAADAGRG